MFYPKNPKRPNHQSANMAHFVAFCIGFQKNIPMQNPPGEEGGYMAAQGIIEVYVEINTRKFFFIKYDSNLI